MRRLFTAAALIAFCAIVGLSIWGLSGLTHHAIVAIDKWGDAAPAKGSVDGLVSKAEDAIPVDLNGQVDNVAGSISSAVAQYGSLAPAAAAAISETAKNINRPCGGIAGSQACGTLAQVNKTMAKVGDEIVITQTEQRATLPHVTAAMDSFRDAALGLQQNSADLNTILKDAAITGTAENFAAITDSWAGISADGRKVADKVTADYLKPVPWYMQPFKKSSDILDIGAAIARHTP